MIASTIIQLVRRCLKANTLQRYHLVPPDLYVRFPSRCSTGQGTSIAPWSDTASPYETVDATLPQSWHDTPDVLETEAGKLKQA
ncbi:hypothetical protein JTE90_009728 [Oedothorax gibbosus]|uniref:Uncharacterized protein n=1 Tax=Oedothorax gibbosus TaxID=931172 RepID=A0AAV6V7I9_9ARAC|nr:hypothetical protein JTE90_009728 [Oedothorax gibbosus]